MKNGLKNNLWEFVPKSSYTIYSLSYFYSCLLQIKKQKFSRSNSGVKGSY